MELQESLSLSLSLSLPLSLSPLPLAAPLVFKFEHGVNSDVFLGPTLCHICNAVLWHFSEVAGYIAPQPKSL